LLKLELDTGIGTLRSVSGYSESSLVTTFDAGGTYVADNYSTSDIRERNIQEAVDFNINAIDRVDLILGGTYFNINTHYAPGKDNVVYLAPTIPGGAPPVRRSPAIRNSPKPRSSAPRKPGRCSPTQRSMRPTSSASAWAVVTARDARRLRI
jgi:hypothetical protein